MMDGCASPARMSSTAPATGSTARQDGYGVLLSSHPTATTMHVNPISPNASCSRLGQRRANATNGAPIMPPAMNSHIRQCIR